MLHIVIKIYLRVPVCQFYPDLLFGNFFIQQGLPDQGLMFQCVLHAVLQGSGLQQRISGLSIRMSY
jgi:hypothetical protein